MSAAPAPDGAPRVSIGMPVYNGARYLEEALRSILAQTYRDFELIVSDNASTDATGEILRRYAAADPRIQVVRNATNIGAAANYNRVFRLARGRYFKHAAHDDVLGPTLVERCVAVLESDPTIVLAYPRMVVIDAEGRRIDTREHSLELDQPTPSARFAAWMERCDQYAMCDPVFGLFRADALRSTGLIGSYISADMILLAEIALRGRVGEVPEYLFFERYHATGSVLANPTLDDRAAWFDPANRGRRINQLPHLRWLWELLRAIGRAPLSSRERLRCTAALRRWLWRQKRGIVEDGLRLVRSAAPHRA